MKIHLKQYNCKRINITSQAQQSMTILIIGNIWGKAWSKLDENSKVRINILFIRGAL